MPQTQTRQPWTPQMLKSLNGLKTGRTTVQQLSQRLGRTPGAIRQKAFSEGISIKQTRGNNQNRRGNQLGGGRGSTGKSRSQTGTRRAPSSGMKRAG